MFADVGEIEYFTVNDNPKHYTTLQEAIDVAPRVFDGDLVITPHYDKEAGSESD